MNSYKQTLNYLYGLQNRGLKFGLHNIKTLLASAGNPEKKFRTIHIAGTNGKGSTASFLASIFMEAGYRTALYTSPHLVRFTERIRINGIEISERSLVSYARLLRPVIETVRATFFEATTCIAFQYFADENVDIAVIETGLGGRLDSTNVLRPLVSVITNVSMDHTEYLGRTLMKIAREKGGIIKRNVPCITASTDASVLRTLKGIARRKSSTIIEARKRVGLRIVRRRGDQFVVNIRGRNISALRVKPGLKGIHQLQNASTAIAAIDVLLDDRQKAQAFPGLKDAIMGGMENIAINTGLRGRLESTNSGILLDVAHNEAGIRTLAGLISARRYANLIVVFGVMKDKNYTIMSELLGSVAHTVVAVQPKNKRALDSSDIVRTFRAMGRRVIDGKSVRNGIRIARRLSGKEGKILVTGSHYVVGEALEFMESGRKRRGKSLIYKLR